MASVVVVGGGIAGLTCGWRLQRAGHDVEVLECEAEAGGRLRSERRGEFVVERGARFVSDGDRNLHALVAALGLEDRLYSHRAAPASVLRGGRLQRAAPLASPRLLTSPLLSPGARLRLARLPLQLLRHRRALDPLQLEGAAEFDDRDMSAGLRPWVGDEAFDFLVEPAFAAAFHCAPEDVSFGSALLAMRRLATGARLQSFSGGNGTLTAALARQLRVRTGCEVESVLSEDDGARIRYRRVGRAGAVSADAVVVAVPAPAVAGLCPKLTPAERGFFESVRYVRGTVVHLLFERAPAALRGSVLFPRSEDVGLYRLAVDPQLPGAAPPGAGLANATLTEAASDRLWDAADQAVTAHVLAEISRTPLGRLHPSDCAVHRWPALIPRFEAGSVRRLGAFHRRLDRSPRMAFAGDYLLGPNVEGALSSGARAATEIARTL